MVSQKKPNFLFLCETKSSKKRMEWIRVTLGFEGMFVVEPQGRSGSVAFLWRWKNDCYVLGYSNNHIDMAITRENEDVWRFTGLYGEPNRNRRHLTWSLIRKL